SRFLARGEWHVESPFVQNGRAGDCGKRMRVDADDPERHARRRIERIDIPAKVAEVRGVRGTAVTLHRPDADRVANTSRGLEAPREASALRIERIDVARVRAKEDA